MFCWYVDKFWFDFVIQMLLKEFISGFLNIIEKKNAFEDIIRTEFIVMIHIVDMNFYFNWLGNLFIEIFHIN